MKKVLLLTTIGVLVLCTLAKAQNVFNPADRVRRWVNNGTNYSNDSTAATANPNPGIPGVQKWVSVKTSGVDSNSWGKDYKPYFINFNGIQVAFRVKFPKSYTNVDSAGKIYPGMLFFHGAGEPGCPSNGGIYNNEKQLIHGGQRFRNIVEANQFDGFLIYPQAVAGSSCWSDWGVPPYSVVYTAIIAMLDTMGRHARLDIDRIFVDGLSNGGVAAWGFTAVYPQRVAKSAPSAAATPQTNYQDFVHIPIWFATGAKDTNPLPSYAQSSYDGVKNFGGDIRWTLYPDLGHFVWDTHWGEPDFIPFMNSMHKANPLVYFQRYDYCPDSAINSRIGITGGFYEYEWQKDGVTIATRVNGVNTIIDGTSIISFTGNELRVRSFGTYRVRFRRLASSNWSAWSPKPAVIYPKPTTQTPPITVDGLNSKVLPSVDGSNTVPLKLPAGYSGYQWERVGDNTVLSTQNTFVAPAGQYRAKIVEQFGCGSFYSPTFTVISAAGSPKPDAAKNLSAVATSVNGIQLDWNENPNAGQNETGFEIYRATTSGGPYKLLTITAPNVVSYLDQDLVGNTQYYYVVRAVSDFGAAANSNEAQAAAQVDNIAPSIPSGLTVTCSNRTNVFLKWNPSTDNLAVAKYDIFVNGVKTYTTSGTYFEAHELTPRTTYSFTVVARDAAGNSSQPSNQVTANTVLNGICYKYYNNTPGLVELPDYNTLTPTARGVGTNVAFTAGGAGQENFGYLWEGYINIPSGSGTNFRLRTCSDDGSKLYFNSPYNYSAAATINNDGLHGSTCVQTGNINMTAGGIFPLALVFFENGGGEEMRFEYSTNGGSNFAAVPNSWFTESAYTAPGGAPAAPSNVNAVATAFDRINITWTDNSNNETGFEVVRSTSAAGTFVPVATTAAGATSYIDSGLAANTKYYYKVRSVGAYGQSSYSSSETIWNFNGSSYADKLDGGTNRNLTAGDAPVFSTDKAEGDVSIRFDGSNDYAALAGSEPDGGFPSDGGYSQRTVSLWFKLNGAQRNSKRMFWEFGGSDNGMALRSNSTSNSDSADLEARVISNSVGFTATLANYQTNANFIAGGWNHVVVSYSGNSIRIFLNGTQVAINSGITFTSVGTPTSSSRIAMPTSTGTGHAFNDATYTNFNGAMDDIQVLNEGAQSAEVTLLRTFAHGQSMDTTFAAPAIPTTPSSLTATVVSKDNIDLNWNDNSANETHFEIWRSVGNQANYRMIKTVPGGAGATKSFSDTALFANITYYYVVKAVGAGGASPNSNIVFATTANTAPVMTNILDFTMKYGTSYSLPINAVDEDGDPMTFTFENMPSFINIENVNNGNINVVFSPTIGDQGSFTITAMVDDGNNGKDTTYFTMVINDNTVPTMTTVTDKTVDEGKTIVIPLSANDAEGNDYMVWSMENMPSFGTFVDSGNGKASITLKPGYAASGIYNMTAFVDDGNGAWTSRSFRITVNEVDPNESFKINFRTYSGFLPTWNDVDLYSAAPFNRTALVTAKGVSTTVGIQAMGTNYGAISSGVQTGNNSGVYPDAIMKDYMEWGTYVTGASDTLRLRVYGLDTARRYNFVFFGSSNFNCCGVNANSVTTFRIDNQVAQTHFYLNVNETDTIYQVKPNAAGQVIITMIGDASTQLGGVLNALIVDAAYDDGSAPAKPLNLFAKFTENAGVRLTWVDRSYNEFSYKVYRATSKSGPYTLINPGQQSKDSVGYTDLSAQQYTTYYYYVVGSNNYGEGTPSDTVSIATGNNKPVINGLVSFAVKTDDTFQEDFTVTDFATDVVTVSIQNKPSFITLSNQGGNNYRITASPTIDNYGQHFITVVAADDKGGVTTRDVVITVNDKNTTAIYVNMGDYSKNAPAPWNNFLNYGSTQLITGLLDENGAPTSVSLQISDPWTNMYTTGHKTGNNSGAVADSVLSGGIYYIGTNARSMVISGLPVADANTRYNIVAISSRNEGIEANMRVSVGSVSDTVNGKYNTNMTANVNGLTPVGGSLTVNFQKIGNIDGSAIHLNGLIIERYQINAVPILNPVNLYAEPKDRNTVVLTWSDRSNNEAAANNGFELQRSTDSLFGTFTTTNIWGNNSTVTVTGLTENTKYWFRIRARTSGGTLSDWSNRVKTITPQSLVFVNFNQNVQNAGAPWNNLETFPAPGVEFQNLKNQSNVNTGYKLAITKTFNGENNAGMTTGNNSGMGGLVPDAVMQSSYWIDNQQQSQVVISGLNKNKRYRIGFISSSNWIGGDLTATFTINGTTRYINSWKNTSKIVYIGNLQANDDGQLEVNISSTAASANAYSSGLIIESYDDVNGGAVLNSVNPNPDPQQKDVVAVEQPTETLFVAPGQQIAVNAYPNPFTELVNIDFVNTSSTNTVALNVYDVSGRMVMSRNFGKLSEGAHTLKLNTTEGKLSAGVYMMTLTINGKPVSVTKLVKTKQ